MNLEDKLTPHFSLIELLRSDTAERRPSVLAEQYAPPIAVVENLRWLCEHALEPLRVSLGYPMRISSGYRSPALNKLVGGSKTSQHTQGQAADIQLADDALTDPRTEAFRNEVAEAIQSLTGKPLRPDANANFLLFAYTCLHLADLQVDQLIHEYGRGAGEPAWTHVSVAPDRNRREILIIGDYTGKKYRRLDLVEALTVGT